MIWQWALLVSTSGLLFSETAFATRQLMQLSQSRPRIFHPEDHIVPETGQDVPNERLFSIRQPTLDSQFKVQFNASWALDRLDQATVPLDSLYRFSNGGDTVSIYVLDSGILASHVEFQTLGQSGSTDAQTRAQDEYTSSHIPSKSAAQGSNHLESSSFGGSAPGEDCSGHGTHVASLIGGLTFGVAKKTNLKAVRVLACDGSTSASAIIEALEWVSANAQRPAIAVVAVAQTGYIPSLEHALERLVLNGVPVLAAAGNSDTNACDVSPASSPFAITVGASDSSDQRLELPEGVGSNYGPCIDIFAPGESIPGASADSDTGGVRLSGTSQAVAFAAGAAAIHMHAFPDSSPAQLRQALASTAAVGQVSENLPEEFVNQVLGDSPGHRRDSRPAVQPVSLSPAIQEAADASPVEVTAERGQNSPRSDERMLQQFQDSGEPYSSISSETAGAKRSVDHTPLLQVAGLASVPLVATSPSVLELLPANDSSLDDRFDVEIVLAQPAKSDGSIMIAETATVRAGELDLDAAWGQPQRFGGPFTAALAKGTARIKLQLPLNHSIAMSSAASDSFFLSVLVSSDDVSLDQKQIPLQVVDRKGWIASYPKVITATPYQDNMFTDGAGSELQQVLDLSPCVGSDQERQFMHLEGSAGDDVVYFFKPSKSCNAVVSLCGGNMATELIVLSYVDQEKSARSVQVQQQLAKFENCQVSDTKCITGNSLRVPMTADVGYLFIARGRFGGTGEVKFSLECDNSAGQLPSWTGTGKPLPTPLVALQKGILHSSAASSAAQVPVTLWGSPCAVHAVPHSLSSSDQPTGGSANNLTSSPSATSVRTTSTLALLPGNEAKWCPFCAHGDMSQAACTTPYLATAANVISSSWSRCGSSCRGDSSTRAQFCSVPVACVPGPTSESDQLCRATSSKNAANRSSLSDEVAVQYFGQDQEASGAFKVLQSAHLCGISEDVLRDTRVQGCGDKTVPDSSECEVAHWKWQEFGDCSKPCGGGTRERRAMCVAPSGRFRKDTVCSDSKPLQPQVQACNTHACSHTLWYAEKWGACEPNGIRTRSVQCIQVGAGGQHTYLDDSLCHASVKPVEFARCSYSPVDAVLECAKGDCYKGNCTQSGAYCECELGWHGQRCDTRVDCPGLTSSRGECCPHLRGADSLCCTTFQLLDRNGMCCDPESLDVCRVCNGTATVLDLVGTCGAGSLDAGGRLCEGRLDECGVCGGTGMSCDMYSLVLAALAYYPSSQTRASLESAQRQHILQAAVSNARGMLADELEIPAVELGLNVSAHGWQLATGASGAVWVATLSIEVRFAPLAVPITHSRALNLHWLRSTLDSMASRSELSLADDSESLAVEAAVADWKSDNASVVAALDPGDVVKVLMSEVASVGREGVCGNNICEVGELLPVATSGVIGQRCVEDCPLEVIGCPQNFAGEICSGHGACIHGTGLCGCDLGYSGEACDVCAPSHFKKDGFCVTPLLSPRSQAASRSKFSPLVIIITTAAILTVVFVLVVTCHAMYCGGLWWRSCSCRPCCGSCRRRCRGSLRPASQKRHHTSSSGADSFTDDVLHDASKHSRSPLGSPTCMFPKAFMSAADMKGVHTAPSPETTSRQALTSQNTPDADLNSTTPSFQTATSKLSPARQHNSCMLSYAALATADGDRTISSVLSPDEISIKLHKRSTASRTCSQSAGLRGVHPTPTKGGKFRWSEVQHESSAKLSQTSHLLQKGNVDMHAMKSLNRHSGIQKASTSTSQESPGEQIGALINYWKRSSDAHARRTGSTFSGAMWTAGTDDDRKRTAAPTHQHLHPPVIPLYDTAGVYKGDSFSTRQSHIHALQNLRSQSLTHPLPCSYPPNSEFPSGVSYSQPVTYTSRSASIMHSLSASTGFSKFARRGAAHIPPDAHFADGFVTTAQSQNHSRRRPEWVMHQIRGANTASARTIGGRSNMMRMGSMQEAESSLISQQASQISYSCMPASSSFWHDGNLHSRRSQSSTAVMNLHQQHNKMQQQSRDRETQAESIFRRSSSLPPDSKLPTVNGFLPTESPPSLVPPSTLPSSMDDSASFSELTPRLQRPVRAAAASATSTTPPTVSTPSDAAPASVRSTAKHGIQAAPGAAFDGGSQQETSQPSYTCPDSKCSVVSSTTRPMPSSTVYLDGESTETAGSSYCTSHARSRHVYYKPFTTHVSKVFSRCSSTTQVGCSNAMNAGESSAASNALSRNSNSTSQRSKPTPNASSKSNRLQWTASSKMIQSGANSTLLWSQGILPDDHSGSPWSDGDTFMSHPHRRLPVMGQEMSQQTTPGDNFTPPYSGSVTSATSATPALQPAAWKAHAPQLPGEGSGVASALTGIQAVDIRAPTQGSRLSKDSHVASNTCAGPRAAGAASISTPGLSAAPQSHPSPMSEVSNAKAAEVRKPPPVFKNLASRIKGPASTASSPRTATNHQRTSSATDNPVHSPCMAMMHHSTASIPSPPPSSHNSQQPLTGGDAGVPRVSLKPCLHVRDTENQSMSTGCTERSSDVTRTGTHAPHMLFSSALDNTSINVNKPPCTGTGSGATSSGHTDLKGYTGTESTMLRGLSIYQSTQIPSELHGAMGTSAFESGHPRETASVMEGGTEAVTASQGAPSAALSRKCSARSRSSTSRMGMSREQLAWEHYGSISDGGLTMPSALMLRVPNTAAFETAAETVPDESASILHSTGSNGFGMSTNLGSDITHLMHKVKKMQSRAEKGFLSTSQSSLAQGSQSFGSPQSQSSYGGVSRSGQGGHGDKFESSHVPSILADGRMVGDSVELNFMHGMALWSREENNYID